MRKALMLVAGLAVVFVVSGTSPLRAESGRASHYGSGDGFHGKRTANGERFNRNAATCAHRTHKFGTMLRVTNTRTGASTTCRVSDRGPARRTGKIIDMSRHGAIALGMLGSGVIPVRIEVIR